MNDCQEVRHLLGVYVLGAIDPGERARVNEHLAKCQACREELAGLAGLPALLGRVTLDEVEAPGDAPPRPLDQILVKVAQERRRRRRSWAGLAAAAAVVAALIAGGSFWLHPGSGSSLAARTSISASDPRTHVRGWIGLADQDWGTAVTVRLADVAPQTHCQLIAVDRSGRREVAGNWRTDYEGKATFIGATAISRRDLAQLNVVTSGGRVLLTVPVH
jgi:anti-sigma factor RsiW